jgi:hypothetical protein
MDRNHGLRTIIIELGSEGRVMKIDFLLVKLKYTDF